jgi:hypothetical protein
LVAPLVAVAAIVILAVGAVAQIGPSSGPDRRVVDRSFAVLANAIVAQSNASGVALNALLVHGPGLLRTTFFSDLDSLSVETGQADRRFAALTPPDPAGATVRQCGATMVDRQRAATEVGNALQRLLGGRQGLGGGDEAEAAGALGSAGSLLTSADASWEACRRTLLRSAGSARLRTSTWMSDPSLWTQGSLGPFVVALVSSASLAPVHRLSLLALSTDPASVPGRSGVSVLPPTSALRVHVVLADVGNVDEPGVVIVVSAVPQGTSRVPPPVRERVGVDAGGASALSLPPLQVGPGRSYALQITATAPGGATASMSVDVRVSVVPPSPTTTTTTTIANTTTRATTTPSTRASPTTSKPVRSG